MSSFSLVITEDNKQTCADLVVSGDLTLTTPVLKKTERLSPMNLAGYTLLRTRLDEMSPREISFAGSMTALSYPPTAKQAKWMSDLFKTYLDQVFTVDADANF
jgi:hypothetical protein